jgi:hypothetical protein
VSSEGADAAAGRIVTRADLVPFVRTILARARALPKSTLAVRRFRMAGLTVEVAFGSRGSSGDLTDAYSAHMGLPLAGGEEPADLRFFVLSAADLDLAASPEWGDTAWPVDAFGAALERLGLFAEYPWLTGVWRLLDTAEATGVLLMNTPADLPAWDGGAPLVDLLRPALAGRGIRVVHAATLGAQGRGVLLVGDGGAGKSATTLAGLAAGLGTAGDDYIGVSFEGGEPVARMLYRMMKQDRSGLARHAGHAVASAPGEPNWRGKIEFAPELYFPGCLAERLALKAVVIPHIAAGEEAPAIVPATGGEALRVAMRTNLFNGSLAEGMHFFARLLKLPCYRMTLAPDAAANGAALARLVAKLPGVDLSGMDLAGMDLPGRGV